MSVLRVISVTGTDVFPVLRLFSQDASQPGDGSFVPSEQPFDGCNDKNSWQGEQHE
jgi:hypothetical protein